MKYVNAAILSGSLLVSASASAEDFGPSAAQQSNVTERVMTSPSALDAGQNSNYPLDPNHTVAMDNSSVVMPNNNGPVQSANSLPVSITPESQFANHRTQPVARGNAATESPANPNG